MTEKFNKPKAAPKVVGAKKNIYGQKDEIPTVFSKIINIDFKQEIGFDELAKCLDKCVENIQKWAINNNYFIGHIKVFADLNEKNNVWISTTGDLVNVKKIFEGNIFNTKHCSLNFTAIIFGANEQNLKETVYYCLKDSLKNIDIIN
jgi:hypothetical protein